MCFYSQLIGIVFHGALIGFKRLGGIVEVSWMYRV